MAYDYSLGFLDRHRDEIDMVNKCYQQRTAFTRTFDYPTECDRARININNVVRSLAVHYPEEYNHVRQVVRTKVLDPTTTNGKWVLKVYASMPGEKIEGRPPGRSTKSTWIEQSGNAIPVSNEYQFPDLIKGPEEFTKFVGQVLEAPETVKQVFAEFEVEIANLDYFNDLFGEHGWIAHLNGPTTLILERP